MLKKNIKKKIKNLLKKLGIKKNDNVLIHSNSAGIFQYGKSNRNLNIFFEVLIKEIGANSTIIFPTYNYSNLKKKIIDWQKCISEVGVLSNYMLNNKKFVRTKNPVFSHIIYGNLKNEFLNSNNLTAFKNENNFFQKLINYKFKIIGFCCPLNTMTLLHYIEAQSNVPYRFNKKFNLKIKDYTEQKKIVYDYFVGKKKINYSIKENKIKKLLASEKKIKFSNLGKFECWVVYSNQIYNSVLKKLKGNKYYLIR